MLSLSRFIGSQSGASSSTGCARIRVARAGFATTNRSAFPAPRGKLRKGATMQNLNRWRRRWEPPGWGPPQRPNASYTKVAAVSAIAGAVLCWAALCQITWHPLALFKHIAAFPNCSAARAVGVAPARRGEPGYWPSHDADDDGIACENFPVRRFSN
jgi:hypothetical protein